MGKEAFVLKKICEHDQEWTKMYVEKGSDLKYIDVIDFAEELMDCLIHGNKLKVIKKIFGSIEELLIAHGEDIAITSFIIAGLFNLLQNKMYHSNESSDLVEPYLGEISKKYWGDYIEGWTGKGIRTIDLWRRVLINGKINKLGVEFLTTNDSFQFTEQQAKTTLGVPPLIAETFIGWRHDVQITDMMGFSQPYAIISFHQQQISNTLTIGNLLKGSHNQRFVTAGKHLAILDMNILESIKFKK